MLAVKSKCAGFFTESSIKLVTQQKQFFFRIYETLTSLVHWMKKQSGERKSAKNPPEAFNIKIFLLRECKFAD